MKQNVDYLLQLQHTSNINKIEELSDVETEEEAMYQREPNGEDGHSKTKKKTSEFGKVLLPAQKSCNLFCFHARNKQDIEGIDEQMDDVNDPDWFASKDEICLNDENETTVMFCTSSDDDSDSENWSRKWRKLDSSDDETDEEQVATMKKPACNNNNKYSRRSPWTVEEKRCVENSFAKYILLTRVPEKGNVYRKLECGKEGFEKSLGWALKEEVRLLVGAYGEKTWLSKNKDYENPCRIEKSQLLIRIKTTLNQPLKIPDK
ncbi:hypothetical protein KUTeg_014596 [Tegillarca granosa]|uniref:Uncharacterized protein n=1 Tax=Tegillarca granosa TaxID=220873 RepID=A0ABQ9EX22_TEGGR|nr:hypothetical protein KUTeg_014596 [Tegillarca granosa]